MGSAHENAEVEGAAVSMSPLCSDLVARAPAIDMAVLADGGAYDLLVASVC